MSFWDGYTDTSGYGSDFATKEEKEALAKSGETFDITKIVKGKSKFGERYLVTVLTQEGDEKALTFAAVKEVLNKETGEMEDVGVESRDQMFDQMIEWFGDPENKDETVPATMAIVNRSYIISEA